MTVGFTSSASKVQQSNLDEELQRLELAEAAKNAALLKTSANCTIQVDPSATKSGQKPVPNLTSHTRAPNPGRIPLQDMVLSDPYQLLHQPLPVNSPVYTEKEYFPENETVWSILPLYHMYTSVVSKSLDLTQDDNVFIPPNYDAISTTSSGPSTLSDRAATTYTAAANSTYGTSNSNVSDSSLSILGTSDSNVSLSDNYIVADENLGQWQNTILDNVHKLKNLSDSTTNKYSKSIEIDVYFTKDVGKAGVKPEFIDTLEYEYKQGDLINGYFLVKNTSNEPIPFDMFYVLFEGNFKVRYTVTGPILGQTKEVRVTRKFLEMFDFSASWHYGYINRLVTDYKNPASCSEDVDPLDNTVASFGLDRSIKPGLVHKRFFTFRIPDKLLDSSCDTGLSGHGDLPPTTGISPCHKQKRTLNPEDNDYSFIDTSINYTVCARFIGKASMYGESSNKEDTKTKSKKTIINCGGDEFLILKAIKASLRIIPETTHYDSLGEKIAKFRQDKILYYNLCKRVDDQISLVRDILKVMQNEKLKGTIITDSITSFISPNSNHFPNLSPAITTNHEISDSYFTAPGVVVGATSQLTRSITSNEIAKCRQLYHPRQTSAGSKGTSDVFLGEEFPNYRVFFPMQKKTLTGHLKYYGTIIASTPKIPHILSYIAPKKFEGRSEVDDSSWVIDVPIDLEYVLLEGSIENTKLPEISKINVEFVVSTVKSETYPIPIEFNHDMIFESNKQVEKTLKLAHEYDSVYFDNSIVKPFRKKIITLQSLVSKLAKESFRMDAQLVENFRSVCNLKAKNINMVVEKVSVSGSKLPSSMNSALQAIPWVRNEKTIKPVTHKKSFVLSVDLRTSRLKTIKQQKGNSYDNFCLIPSYQHCYMIRYYFLKVIITLQKGEVILVTVPIEIKKSLSAQKTKV